MNPGKPDGREFLERVCVFSGYGLYSVITEKFCAGRSSVDVLQDVARAGVKLVQLREKDKSKKEIYETALTFRSITRAHGIIFIVDDHPDIALAAEADGVHLGVDDIPVGAVRRFAPGLLAGVSTHSAAEALAARRIGAGYINVGPLFATSTKINVSPPLGVSAARDIISGVDMPVTVMGGIKESNLIEAAGTGARVFAMVTEITASPDIPEKIGRLAAVLASLPISKNRHNLL